MGDKKNVVEDFLEADPEIPGQKFVCLSFVSPENILANKEVFKIHKFLEVMAKNYDLDVNSVQEKYKDFLYVNEEKIEKDFFEANDFQTTVRGLKVRGVYDTHKEAEMRAKRLQKLDRNHNVFIGQVGFWLPWDPSSHRIENQEYQEPQLNELVHKLKENQDAKEAHFQENIEYVREQQEKKNKEQKEINAKEQLKNLENSEENTEQVNNTSSTEQIKDNLDEVDPWMARRTDSENL